MSCGCPVACSNVSSLPEVVGKAARLFDPYDINSIAEAIKLGITDEAWRQEATRKGFLRVKDFSWEKPKKKLLRFIKNC